MFQGQQNLRLLAVGYDSEHGLIVPMFVAGFNHVLPTVSSHQTRNGDAKGGSRAIETVVESRADLSDALKFTVDFTIDGDFWFRKACYLASDVKGRKCVHYEGIILQADVRCT